MHLSVIVPTFNRQTRLEETLAYICAQNMPASDYEVIVVDDGSTPPTTLPRINNGPSCTLLRFEEILERCVARNRGAEIARGDILVFLDDDLEVGPGFLQAHLQAHLEWPGTLVAGGVHLPPSAASHPFVRFRQAMELQEQPASRGPTCNQVAAAGNFSMSRTRYRALGGFDTSMVGIEDQDFAFRHRESGGTVVFLPEATAVHWDHALTVRPYCLRTEFAGQAMLPLVRRYPDWPVNRKRESVNGPVRLGREPWHLSAKKVIKTLLGLSPITGGLLFLTSAVEKAAPNTGIPDRLYRLLIGVFLQRGYRKALRTAADVNGSSG
jgi:glycosyltransferase involved in cell wall biosynthesis